MGILDKLFGSKKGEADEGAVQIVEETLDGIFGRANFDLSYDLSADEEGNINVEIFGNDQENLIDKEGQLLDAFQLYLKRVLQHQLPDLKTNVNCDSNGFRKEASEELIRLADKLKKIAIDKNKSVYFRALAPKDRKTIHQYLAEDGRVKSRSVGEGHFKKIKIFPAKAGDKPEGSKRADV
jgi:spoIIIJ-associated protein